MSSVISIFNVFTDLKKKSSKGGGFSDGGIVSGSVTLKVSTPVTIAPPKGLNWGGLALNPYGSSTSGPWAPGGVTVVNFDTNQVTVEEYIVLEDGTEVLVGSKAVSGEDHSGVSRAFATGFILSNPNKLRYKLVANPAPTKRVLLKYALVEYDQFPA